MTLASFSLLSHAGAASRPGEGQSSAFMTPSTRTFRMEHEWQD